MPPIKTHVTYYGLTYSDALRQALMYASTAVYNRFVHYGAKQKKGDFLDISKNGQISWRPLNRLVRREFPFSTLELAPVEEQYETKGRMFGKPAKTIRDFMGTYASVINDQTWELFSNRFLAGDPETKIELVSGGNIKTLYHESRITRFSEAPTLRQSCMRYTHTEPYLNFYAANPAQIQMLVEFDPDNNVMARALVWKTDRGVTFLDRVYGDNNSVEKFRAHAEKNGWWYRWANSYAYPNSVVIDGEKKTRMLRVTLDKDTLQYPFLDTFLWYSIEDRVLSNTPAGVKGRGNVVQLRTTNGSFITPYRRRR